MSEQDTMRLVAEVVDKYSGPLKEMQKAMRELSDMSRGVHGAGKKSAQEHAKAYSELRESVAKVKEGVSSALTPAMAVLGITTLSVSGAIAAVVESVKKLGDESQHFDQLGRRSGFALQSIRELQAAFVRLGMSKADADATLANFGSLMDRLKAGSPEARDQINSFRGAFQGIGRELAQIPDKAKALERLFDWGDKNIVRPDQLREFYRVFGVTQQMADVRRKDREAALAAGKRDAHDPFDIDRARKFKEAMDNLNASFEHLQTMLGTEFAPGLTTLLDKLTGWFHDDGVSFFKGEIAAIAKGFEDTHREISAIMNFVNRFRNQPNVRTDPNAKSPLNVDKYFGLGGPANSTDTEKTIKKGTLEALRDWWNGEKSAGDGAAGGGGYTDGRRYSRMLNPGGPGGRSGGGPSFSQLGSQRGARGGGYQGDGASPSYSDAMSIPPGPATNSYLQATRAAQIAAINADPVLKENVLKMLQLEEGSTSGKTGAMEAFLNRNQMTGNTPRKELFSGFYGPINRGQLRNALGGKARETSEEAFNNAAGGSNVIHGRTDQGMNGDPNANGPGRVKVPGTSGIFNYWKGTRAGKYFSHDSSRAFADELNAGAAASPPVIPLPRPKPADGPQSNLLQLGKQAGMMGSVQGDASLRIDLNGFPRGTKTKTDYSGMFKEVTLNRGRPMATANEDS